MLTILTAQLNALRLPVWASLARDFLPIMASSVSSERAFSKAGITISKRRNRLKGDIVEALQCLKCAIHHDLLFDEPGPSSFLEAKLERCPDDGEDWEEASDDEENGWDSLIIDEEDEICGSEFDV